jgi:cytochrome c peroxidase
VKSPAPVVRSLAASAALALSVAALAAPVDREVQPDPLDVLLASALESAGFTGRVEEQLAARLGRPVDYRLAELGRLLFFDPVGALHDDNACAGCHAPSAGLGDTQSIAIGIQSNRVVGPGRAGPRNQRRTPTVVNTAFYPKLMWNGRFAALSGDPFDGSLGFRFPLPEGDTRFPARDPVVTHLLIAQAHIPPTELVEVAGFTGTFGQLEARFGQFDDGLGGVVPPADTSGFRNEPIRKAVLARLNASAEYRRLFGALFPPVAAGAAIDFTMFGRAIAEFEFSMVRADAPLDRFARGERYMMTASEKRGALVFFGKGGCVSCHAVAGQSNEMFSDFRMHVAAVPQIAPRFGLGSGNVIFDGPNEDEDFGLEQITVDSSDRYRFRTSPLRNLAVQPAFFHNGAFTRLEDALRYHLATPQAATQYDPQAAGLAADLHFLPGPIGPPLARLDPLLAAGTPLSASEFDDLATFLRTGLLDPGVLPRELCLLVPPTLPSGMRPLRFEGCAGVTTDLGAP